MACRVHCSMASKPGLRAGLRAHLRAVAELDGPCLEAVQFIERPRHRDVGDEVERVLASAVTALLCQTMTRPL